MAQHRLCITVVLVVSVVLHAEAFPPYHEHALGAKTMVFSLRNVYARQFTITAANEPESISSLEKMELKHPTTRFIAVQALLFRKGSSVSATERLENIPGYNNLSTRDRSFCRLLVTTAERRLGQLDAVLSHCQTQKPKRKNLVDQLIQAVLRVGAVQILFLNVPPHAAVKETVDVLRMRYPQVKTMIPEMKIKYVNAVLRRLTREGDKLLAKHSKLEDNATPWLIEEWKRTWGEEATQNILKAAMREAPRCLTIRQSPEAIPEAGEELIKARTLQIEAVAALFESAEVLPQGSVRVLTPPDGPVSSWPHYNEGAWWLQDASATIPAIALYHELSQGGQQSVHNMTVVDLCAAPGGKTAQLSNYGFGKVVAVEQSARRCRRLKQNMERLKMDWEIVVADGTEWIPEQRVDGLLVDAPCTATGTASRRPDVLRRDPDLKDLLDLQYKLACHAADEMLKTGGIMVYATCSLLKRESEEQVSRLLERKGGAALVTLPFLPGEIPGFNYAINENGYIRVIPGVQGCDLGHCDGFFVAKLKRVD